MFNKATKKKAKLRMALQGPSGGGKTFTALAVAKHLAADGKRVALCDTEKGSASKYSDRFDFDVCEIVGNYNPKRLHEVIDHVAKTGVHDVLVLDSLTHFWNGAGGLLEMIDEECNKQRARGGKGDSFMAWKTVDPVYRRLVDAILQAPFHVIMTLRAKQSYESTKDDNGKTKIQKMGLAPQFRDDFQYEADIEGMLDIEHNLVIGKTRCDALDGRVFKKPGEELAMILRAWLEDGVEKPPPPPSAHVEFLSRVTALRTIEEYQTIAKEYQEKKATFAQAELQEQIRALRAKHDELKQGVST